MARLIELQHRRREAKKHPSAAFKRHIQSMDELLIFCILVLPAVLVTWWLTYEEDKRMQNIIKKWEKEAEARAKDGKEAGA